MQIQLITKSYVLRELLVYRFTIRMINIYILLCANDLYPIGNTQTTVKELGRAENVWWFIFLKSYYYFLNCFVNL